MTGTDGRAADAAIVVTRPITDDERAAAIKACNISAAGHDAVAALSAIYRVTLPRLTDAALWIASATAEAVLAGFVAKDLIAPPSTIWHTAANILALGWSLGDPLEIAIATLETVEDVNVN